MRVVAKVIFESEERATFRRLTGFAHALGNDEKDGRSRLGRYLTRVEKGDQFSRDDVTEFAFRLKELRELFTPQTDVKWWTPGAAGEALDSPLAVANLRAMEGLAASRVHDLEDIAEALTVLWAALMCLPDQRVQMSERNVLAGRSQQ